MNKLKGCPFCGGEAGLTWIESSFGGGSWHVGCHNFQVCDANVYFINKSEEGAISTWNTRASPWKPIESCNPEMEVLFLIEGNIYQGRISIGEIILRSPINGFYVSDLMANPTHWMPIPRIDEVK